jgi:hypothetical protein
MTDFGHVGTVAEEGTGKVSEPISCMTELLRPAAGQT